MATVARAEGLQDRPRAGSLFAGHCGQVLRLWGLTDSKKKIKNKFVWCRLGMFSICVH